MSDRYCDEMAHGRPLCASQCQSCPTPPVRDAGEPTDWRVMVTSGAGDEYAIGRYGSREEAESCVKMWGGRIVPLYAAPVRVTEAMARAAERLAIGDASVLAEDAAENDPMHEDHVDALERFLHERIAFHLTAALAAAKGVGE